MKFQDKIYKFMYGRYGIDELYSFLFVVYFILIIIDLFIKNDILFGIELIILTLTFYRCFSKNISRRRKENEIYLKLKKKVLKPFRNIKRNYKDRDCYIYKKCNRCHTTLRLPLPTKKGLRYAKCPSCKKRVRVFCFRKVKTKVIRKGEVYD